MLCWYILTIIYFPKIFCFTFLSQSRISLMHQQQSRKQRHSLRDWIAPYAIFPPRMPLPRPIPMAASLRFRPSEEGMAWGSGRSGCISLQRSTADWRARAILEGRDWRRAGQVLVCRCALWVSTFSFNRNLSSEETLK